jgi:clan AA aspartic protease
MGHSWVDVWISDSERKHTEKVKALVDTGATLTVLPKKLADKLRIKAVTEVEVESGGGKIRLKRGVARIKIEDKEEITPVLVSEIIDKVLLGVVILESLGFCVDPTTGRLKPTSFLLYPFIVP